MIRHRQSRYARAQGELPALWRRAAEDQRIRRPQHRVQVEQHIHGVDQRPDFARPVKLGGTPRAVQRRHVPHAVDVLVDEPRRGRLARIEALVRREIDEPERQLPARRPQPLAQQSLQHDSPGNLVAVRIASSAMCGPGACATRVVKPRTPVLPSIQGPMSGAASRTSNDGRGGCAIGGMRAALGLRPTDDPPADG